MNKLKWWVLAAFALVLGACQAATPSTEAVMLANCKALTSSLSVANTYAASMNEAQKRTVDNVVDIAVPLCRNARLGLTVELADLEAVRDELRRLNELNQEVQ